MKRITPVEIHTPKGKAYLHYIYKDPSLGDLVRILPGIYCERPANFDKLAGSNADYMVFFPLFAANKQKIVEIVGFYPAIGFNKPPFMRTDHNVRGEFLGWHIIDTNTWQRKLVPSLSPEQKQLSPWGTWNDTLLIERISENWSLQNWS
jgi:hypothetical protein